MEATMTAPDTDRAPSPAMAFARRRFRWSADATAFAVFIALALLVTSRLWLSGGSAATADNLGDHGQFLFFFEHAASSLLNFHSPIFTNVIGAPDGVNLMGNAALLGMGVPLIPVTVLLGPGVSFILAVTIGLAGTAAAWYVVLRRHVTTHRGAAFAAAALCGFAPGIVGHANGHPNLTAQFMLPLIVSAVIRLRSAVKPVRSGVFLGLMIAYQIFVFEELLLFTALACGVMAIVYAISQPTAARAEAKPFLTGLGVAAGVSFVLVAYPLWFQFFGPQHYSGEFTWASRFYANLASYPAYGTHSLAGALGSASPLNNDLDETNAFFGLPLCIVALVAAVWLWRVLAARIASVVAVVFGLLSLGDTVRVGHIDTHIPGPWRLVASLPLFGSIITSRLAMIVLPAVAVVLAVAAERVLRDPSGNRQRIVLGWSLLAAVLVPLTPVPVPAVEPRAVPVFFENGAWQEYIDAGTVVPVPPDQLTSEFAMSWVVATDLEMRIMTGYYYGPSGPDDPSPRWGPPPRPTTALLNTVATSGVVPDVSDEIRATVLADLRYWEADALVLPSHDNADALRQTLDALLARDGEERDGVWVWDVRDLVDGQR